MNYASLKTVAAAAFAAIAAWPTSAADVVDIPTGASPSPLFGALPYTQEMPLFEEFGTQPMPSAACTNCAPLPTPPSGSAECTAGPVGSALDDFLNKPIFPLPTREVNTSAQNPWRSQISNCVYNGAPWSGGVAEGRPGGDWFSHQRWGEFTPTTYFQSATTGARVNGGLRDAKQRHGYAVGEFKVGGLYYRGGTTRNTQVRLHPRMPVQNPNSVWTFDGTLPPKLLMARYGDPIVFRHYNALPISQSANMGFGRHTLSTHYHNGHQPAESDGYTAAFFFPGQYYDYRWPMILAGHDSINTGATDLRAATPDGAGGTRLIKGDWRETMSTHWFHDHMLDYTAQNVYKGNAAMANLYSAVDRGREGFRCHYANPTYNVNLCLPSGTALDWGNRDYDVNLLIADKAWDSTGQLYFNIFNTDGFLGDRMTVNWAYKPYMNVRARRYRFRILNGSVSRYIRLAVATSTGQRVPVYMVGNDGNLMEHAVLFPNAQSQDLPVQGIAERYDVVIDFKQFPAGTKLYLYNLMEHKDGRRPERTVPLSSALTAGASADPAVGAFMEFRVVAMPIGSVDRSMNPADYTEGKKKMIPLPMPSGAELATAKRHLFQFGRSGSTSDENPWTIKTDGGPGYNMDSRRVTVAATKGALEIWRLENGDGGVAENGWSHPVHIHFEEGIILARDGLPPPPWERWARKDVFRIGPESSSSVDIALRIRDFMGTYMEHCHNTQHEDHAMLLRWDSRNPGQTIAIPSPRPTWDGVQYEQSWDEPLASTGMRTDGTP
jgi:FtsP/CotA-like multicopper oxidase with cupredoxin domain